ESSRLPLLPGARSLALAGQLTGGCRRNRAWLGERVEVAASLAADLVEIGYDPQTSGGLLAALPGAEGDAGGAGRGAAGGQGRPRPGSWPPRSSVAWRPAETAPGWCWTPGPSARRPSAPRSPRWAPAAA